MITMSLGHLARALALCSLLFVSVTSDFFKAPESQQQYSIFPMDGNSFSEFDETNVHRAIEILKTNVMQWSFIESQLLEPNVDLSMVRLIHLEGHFKVHCIRKKLILYLLQPFDLIIFDLCISILAFL